MPSSNESASAQTVAAPRAWLRREQRTLLLLLGILLLGLFVRGIYVGAIVKFNSARRTTESFLINSPSVCYRATA